MNKTLYQIYPEIARLNTRLSRLNDAIDAMQCYLSTLCDDPQCDAEYEALRQVYCTLHDNEKSIRGRIVRLSAECACLETLPEFFAKRDALVQLPADTPSNEVSAALTLFLEARNAAIKAVFNRDSGVERAGLCSAKPVAGKVDRSQDLPGVTTGYKAIFSCGTDVYSYSTAYRAEFSPDLELLDITKVD